MDNWILQMVRKRSGRRVAAWMLALGCAVLLTVSQSRYLHNFFMGPYELGPDELQAIKNISVSPRYFVRVTGQEAIDTGIKQIKVRKRAGVETSRYVSGKYYALAVGGRFLLYKSLSKAATTVEGELQAVPADVAIKLSLFPQTKSIRARFYPFYLNDASFRFPGYCGIAAWLVFGFFFVGIGVPAWNHWRNPASHPLMQRVSSWGDPCSVAAEAAAESRSPRYQSGGWLLSDKYIIRSGFFHFDLLRVTDLLWSYKRVSKRRIHFIPVGKKYEAILICSGGTAEITGKESTVDRMLAFVSERAPWAIAGFSAEVEQLYQGNKEEFGKTVQRLRQDWGQPARS